MVGMQCGTICTFEELPLENTTEPLNCGFLRSDSMKPDWPTLLQIARADMKFWSMEFRAEEAEKSGQSFNPVVYSRIADGFVIKQMSEISGLDKTTIRAILDNKYRIRSAKMEQSLIDLAAQCAPLWACIDCGLPMDRVNKAADITGDIPASQLH